MEDIAYSGSGLVGGELRHLYGERVHILSDLYHLSLLAKLSAAETIQPEINHLVTTLYRHLVGVVLAREFPVKKVARPTRMIAHHPKGIYDGAILDPDTEVVCVDIARAGMLPAQVCFDALNHVLTPQGVRQDHLVMNRVVDQAGQVVGARIFGEKTGGAAKDRFLLFPDPMGATGTSLLKAINYYKGLSDTAPRRLITMNLIVTPEFIQNVLSAEPDAIIYAFRLDRGLSPTHVLSSVPGTYPELERGLDERQYIIPGAGGLGEVINNVFV